MVILVSQRSRQRRRGFSLVELLVVIAITALLLSILLPSISRARAQAAVVKCASNLRSIGQALQLYAVENCQRYPPNQAAPAPGRFWTDADRIGRFLENRAPIVGYGTGVGIGGGVMVCPSDESSVRSYAMNLWASSDVDGNVRKNDVPMLGELWSPTVPRSSQMILVAECWPSYRTVEGDYYAPPYLGLAGDKPGQKFGGSGGISPPVAAGPYGTANSELPFMRHRNSRSGALGTAPVGRVNIGYADGHVELKAEYELVDPVTGKSTLNSRWSPRDQEIQ
jgi:prepilin-type N-terminal cleavage/methylation domain-containing protein/prepilin-type processing-associated H-X9-DG protein